MPKNIIEVYGIANTSGIAIFDIIHDVDDYVVSALFYGDKQLRTTINKIRTDSSGRSYFIKYGRRCYLDEFMRV